jgi:hypothetical protein
LSEFFGAVVAGVGLVDGRLPLQLGRSLHEVEPMLTNRSQSYDFLVATPAFVKMYNATISMARFYNKSYFSLT